MRRCFPVFQAGLRVDTYDTGIRNTPDGTSYRVRTTDSRRKLLEPISITRSDAPDSH